MKLLQVLADFYAPMTGISNRTLKLYGYTLGAWADLLGRPPELSDLDELSVARFLAHRVRTMSPASAAKDRAQCRAIWEFCSRRGLVKTWPAMPRIVVPERVPEAWLTEEMQAILASAQLEPGETAGFPLSKVFRALVLLCYETGERISAVLELRCQDVRGCSVIFRAENRKGKIRDIVREISVECADALMAVRRKPSDAAIPWEYTTTYVYTKLDSILERAGLPTDRRSKFHRFRKTCASYYEAACGSGSAQRLLDHASSKTTKAYLDPRIVKAAAAAPDVLPKVV
jgi:integrase